MQRFRSLVRALFPLRWIVIVLLPVSWYGAYAAGENAVRRHDEAALERIYDGMEHITDRLIDTIKKYHLDDDDSVPPSCAVTPGPTRS